MPLQQRKPLKRHLYLYEAFFAVLVTPSTDPTFGGSRAVPRFRGC